MNTVKENLPDYAKDLKLNFSSVIERSDDSMLTDEQVAAIALACSFATQQAKLIEGMKTFISASLNGEQIRAAKAAASIMAMNNVYYRSMHLMDDPAYLEMPAGLRMSIIGNPGIEKSDFELMCLAVSAINGCGKCLISHSKVLEENGFDKAAIQHALRISAIINGLAQVIEIENE